jgi:thiosulfate/3-mercaptopyruvate sulfurtransferase
MASSSSSAELDEELGGQMQMPMAEAIRRHDELVFVDGSWWLGPRETTNRQDYERGPRITNARFFDIDDICLPIELNPKGLPHMMPTPTIFAAAMDAMNIRNDDHVVVYGQAGCPFLHRTWLQFAAMGHHYNRLHLLAGSLQDWINADGPVDDQPTTAVRVADLDLTKEALYRSIPPRNVRTFEEMHQIIAEKRDDTTIVDVRSAERFYGQVP